MEEEKKIFAGVLFAPSDPALCEKKRQAHHLCAEYNGTFEEETQRRTDLLARLFSAFGTGGWIQGPLFVHYGCHTQIGEHFFANFNLTIQDDAPVRIGAHCSFGPNVTIVTPLHPMVAAERRALPCADGVARELCYAKPVAIGSDCWLGANVVVCPGVTIGDGCVIGAGSVVLRDIPSGHFAAGNPCQVIRPITAADSIYGQPELLPGLL